MGKGDGSPIHLAGSLPNYVAGWAGESAVLQRNLNEIQTLANLLIQQIGDDCPPGEDGGKGTERGGTR